MSITQAEHHLARCLRHAIDELCNPCRHPLGECPYQYHHHNHQNGISATEQGTQIDEHPYPYQEIRNKQGVTHKLCTVHQRRNMRDETVQNQTCQKRPEDAFHACQFCQSRTEKHQSEDEDILHDIVLVLAEEPTGKPREHQKYKSTIGHALADKPYPRARTKFAPIDARNARQHEQGYGQCKHSTSDGNGHRIVPSHTITSHNGVCHQGVRSQDTRKQQGSAQTEMQQ